MAQVAAKPDWQVGGLLEGHCGVAGGAGARFWVDMTSADRFQGVGGSHRR